MGRVLEVMQFDHASYYLRQGRRYLRIARIGVMNHAGNHILANLGFERRCHLSRRSAKHYGTIASRLLVNGKSLTPKPLSYRV